jgi:pimeloyl-ACP methyl ester carboxylesterase
MQFATVTTDNAAATGKRRVPAGKVRSKDGTLIAFSKTGQGAPLILVDGAMCYRSFGPMPKLAPLLEPHFTVYIYDRRGRGESGDTQPYAVAREVEDIEALINEAGGSAYVFGVSSGAALALEAANSGLAIPRLALYEAPFIVDNSREPVAADYVEQLENLISQGRRANAVKMFMKTVGMPPIIAAIMPIVPGWSKLKAVAHTLPYDVTIMREGQRGRPFLPRRWASVNMPTLVMDGGKSPAWMQNSAQAITEALPNGTRYTLTGQTHMVKPKALAPALKEFFAG